MTRSQTGGSSSGYGRADKRQAIASAARRVFGRDGYTRTSIDTVATEAQVSRRTIYNHFGDKHNLFLAVALEGAVDVTEAINSLMERHLRKVIDLREDLIDFSLDRVAAVSTIQITSPWCAPSSRSRPLALGHPASLDIRRPSDCIPPPRSLLGVARHPGAARSA